MQRSPDAGRVPDQRLLVRVGACCTSAVCGVYCCRPAQHTPSPGGRTPPAGQHRRRCGVPAVPAALQHRIAFVQIRAQQRRQHEFQDPRAAVCPFLVLHCPVLQMPGRRAAGPRCLSSATARACAAGQRAARIGVRSTPRCRPRLRPRCSARHLTAWSARASARPRLAAAAGSAALARTDRDSRARPASAGRRSNPGGREPNRRAWLAVRAAPKRSKEGPPGPRRPIALASPRPAVAARGGRRLRGSLPSSGIRAPPA
jgi:hypothetical protein